VTVVSKSNQFGAMNGMFVELPVNDKKRLVFIGLPNDTKPLVQICNIVTRRTITDSQTEQLGYLPSCLLTYLQPKNEE